MKLTATQRANIRERYGICVNEACDKCSAILGAISYTRRDETEVWCSAKCRGDGQRSRWVGQGFKNDVAEAEVIMTIGNTFRGISCRELVFARFRQELE
jgi:hypothetical protein